MNLYLTTSRIGAALTILSFAMTTSVASAQTRSQSVLIQVGQLYSYRNVAVAWEGPPLWRDPVTPRLELVPELSAGYSGVKSGTSFIRDRGDLWHFGATPILHWYLVPRGYLVLGIGVNYFSRLYIGTQTISTHFQFGDSIGYEQGIAGSPWTVGARFTHYSNLDIKRPDWGVNFAQFIWRYTFK